ncbi:lipopolysaccharide assembly protein LapB [Streptomyces sp. LS1784]|uniref:tetratricopeptide repeat protein n=1 Tax=Streptomyces sp. LS1784 TaxID=2851533 RepID=UPI001CCC1E25|nr:tetratricopeptide repeat protein [Streptomyces sp. LS1784]
MTITDTIDRLSPEERRLLAQIADLPSPDLDVYAVAASTGTLTSHTRKWLGELTAKNLLEHAGVVAARGPVYTIRPEAADRALALADGPGTRTAVLQRYLAYLTTTAYNAARVLTPHHRVLGHASRPEPAEPVRFAVGHVALAWLESMAGALLPAITAATRHGDYQAATCVTHAAWPLFLYTRHELWIPSYRQGLAAAERWGDTVAIREMLVALAGGLRDNREYNEATSCLQRARTLAEGDLEGIAQCSSGIGACLHADARYVEAMPQLTAAATRYERLGHARGQALALILVGSAYARQGNPAAGVPVLQEACTLLSSLTDPDPLNISRALAYLGEAHSLAGAHDLAASALVKALEQFRSLRAPHWTAHTMEFLGQAALRADQRHAAMDWYSTSLAQYTELASSHDTDRLQRRIRAVTNS